MDKAWQPGGPADVTERTTRDHPDSSTLTEADTALFRSVVGPVKPLAHDRVHPIPARRPKPVPSRRLRLAERLASVDSPFDPEVEAGDALSFARPGVPERALRKLRRGQMAVEDQLDLHGMTASDAHGALERFLVEAGRRHLRCVRVIHGKGFGSASGRPVIKAKVSRWLRLHPAVVAYCSAPPSEGGTGAVNLLLKA